MSIFDLHSPFDPWMTHRRPSVYVISDSDMKAYKQKQAAAEILELKRLVDYHSTQAARLQENIAALEKDYPQLAEAADTPGPLSSGSEG